MGLGEVLPAEALGDPKDFAIPSGRVEAVVCPSTDAEVAAVVRWAVGRGVTVLPLGTGLHVPRVVSAASAVVLATHRLRGVRIYEPADLTLTVGAGTSLAELRQVLAPHDQWLPFDPADADGRTLGGLVAAGLSGPLATGYGALRNHVLGATVALGDGRVVRLGGRVVKNVAGFDLLRPMVGSLGGLGVFTEICVRLFPVPRKEVVLVARADAATDLVDTARAVAQSPVMPASAVLVAGVEGFGGGAGLLVRIHGTGTSVAADQQTFERAVELPAEALEGEAAESLLRVVRDHLGGGARPTREGTNGAGARANGIGVASAKSGLFGRLISVLHSTLGSTPLVGDVFAGTVRFEFGPDQGSELATVRREVEVLGGSLGVERLPAGAESDFAAVVTEPRAAEAALTERVRRVFDPPGVFWRAPRLSAVDAEGPHAGEAP